MVNRSCFNDVSGFIREHRHGTSPDGVNKYVEYLATTQVHVLCKYCGIVQTADEVDAGNVWKAAEVSE